ncbi:hypothetical protein Srufu_016560 [Streptomyces libani subsp. rufus]|nr:hypothetical protein Srufu_016560 [Streptomyces libani subsp. rufus]
MPAGPAEFDDARRVRADMAMDVGQEFRHSPAYGRDMQLQIPVPQVRGQNPLDLRHTLRRSMQFDRVVPVAGKCHVVAPHREAHALHLVGPTNPETRRVSINHVWVICHGDPTWRVPQLILV